MCTGYSGIAVLAGIAVMGGYTGTLLAKCWIIVRDRYNEYREDNRHPYPAIGQSTYGSYGRILVSTCVYVSAVGVSVIYLLVAAGNLRELIKAAGTDVSICYWLIILAAILCPITYLGAPKDIWVVAIVAMAAVFTTGCLAIANIIYDGTQQSAPAYHSSTVRDILMTTGTAEFSFGGHGVFPTIQVDMKHPDKFGRGIFFAFAFILCLYSALGASGYAVYGMEIKNNILLNLSHGVLHYMVLAISTVQTFLCIVIAIMPGSQGLEHFFNIPKDFSIGRVLVRTSVVILVLFVAESVPNFGPIVALIGASTESLTVFILPPIFYLRLCAMKGDWDKIDATRTEKILGTLIVIAGTFIVVTATYASIIELITSEVSSPCYLQTNNTAN